MKKNLLALALLVTGLSGCGWFSPPLTGVLKNIKESGVIKVGVRENSVPFSYFDANKQPLGYAIDICHKIIDAVKKEIGSSDLKIEYVPVNGANRIKAIENNEINLECGSTTNNLDRQKQVAFTVSTFVAGSRIVSKVTSPIDRLDQLKGRTIVSVKGTSNFRGLEEYNLIKSANINLFGTKDHAESFAMLEAGNAEGVAIDDVLGYGMVAGSKSPGAFKVSTEALSVEPYAIMLRKYNPEMKQLADKVITGLYQSGEINAIYAKWFESVIPAKNINLNLPMDAKLKKVIANPIDSGDPKMY
jgi:glutamate/aspartate transport system substrate-binding protein